MWLDIFSFCLKILHNCIHRSAKMAKAQRIYHWSKPNDFGISSVPPGVGISIDDTGTIADIKFNNYGNYEIDPTWVDSTGFSFATALDMYNKTDDILSNLVDYFFSNTNIIVWLKFRFHPAWLERIRPMNSKLGQSGFRTPDLAVIVRNTVPYIGTKSCCWTVDVFDSLTECPLLKADTIHVNFDQETRKAIEIPQSYRENVLMAQGGRGEANSRPISFAFPEKQTKVLTGHLEVEERHLDLNYHVHYKTYLFLALECLHGAARTGRLSALGVNESDQITANDFEMVFENESILGDRLRCEIGVCSERPETEVENKIFAAIYRGNVRLTYSSIFIHKFPPSGLSNL